MAKVPNEACCAHPYVLNLPSHLSNKHKITSAARRKAMEAEATLEEHIIPKKKKEGNKQVYISVPHHHPQSHRANYNIYIYIIYLFIYLFSYLFIYLLIP